MKTQHWQNTAVGLWLTAALLMVWATIDMNVFLAMWAIIAVNIAGAVTFWRVMNDCRARMVNAMEDEEQKIDRFASAVLGALEEHEKPRIIRP